MEKIARLIPDHQTSETFNQQLKNTERQSLAAPLTLRKKYAWLVQSVRIVRGLPAQDADEADLAAHELAKALPDIPADMIDLVYQVAMQRYSDTSQPFGAPQLRAAWIELNAEIAAAAAREEARIITDEVSRLNACPHDYVFIPREDSDPVKLLGWYACIYCEKSKPVFNTKNRANHENKQLPAASA